MCLTTNMSTNLMRRQRFEISMLRVALVYSQYYKRLTFTSQRKKKTSSEVAHMQYSCYYIRWSGGGIYVGLLVCISKNEFQAFLSTRHKFWFTHKYLCGVMPPLKLQYNQQNSESKSDSWVECEKAATLRSTAQYLCKRLSECQDPSDTNVTVTNQHLS